VGLGLGAYEAGFTFARALQDACVLCEGCVFGVPVEDLLEMCHCLVSALEDSRFDPHLAVVRRLETSDRHGGSK
jgi:hypothetical protein